MKLQVETPDWIRPTVTRSQSSSTNKHKPGVRKKSRSGCTNCKLRSIKCDETHPHCKRCLSYGLRCTFVHGVADMQLAAPGAIHIIEPEYRALNVAGNCPPKTEAALLAQFQKQVAPTVSLGRRLALFQNQVLILSGTSPSLKHTMISLTMMHDRHMKTLRSTDKFNFNTMPALTEQEIGHWYLASSCFSNDLKSALASAPQQLNIQQQAALCSTSALLVALTFAYMEATTPEHTWPLAGGSCPSSPADLQWISLSNGKLSAQALTQGLATHPTYHPLVVMTEQDKDTFPSVNINTTPIDDVYLLELKQYAAGPEVEAFLQIAHTDCFVAVIFAFWSFVGAMTADFEYGLKHKKPEALLVLLYWFAKLNPLPVWWLKARTSLEGQAICMYLWQYHGHDQRLMNLLQWPTSVLVGLIEESNPTSSA